MVTSVGLEIILSTTRGYTGSHKNTPVEVCKDDVRIVGPSLQYLDIGFKILLHPSDPHAYRV